MKSQIRRFNPPFAQFIPILTLLILMIASAATAMGQQVTAAILGNVADPNGASVAKAKVTARDEARGTIWTTETNSEGVFNLPRVPVGSYEVRVEAQGFRTAVRQAQLELNQTARLDFNLVIGEITQVAEIAAMPPLLQTDTTQLGTVIDSRTNVTLPLASRNYVQLTLLSPGSVNPNPQTLTGAGTSANSGRPYINGNREQANNFMAWTTTRSRITWSVMRPAPKRFRSSISSPATPLPSSAPSRAASSA
jgi:hypothetical protein